MEPDPSKLRLQPTGLGAQQQQGQEQRQPTLEFNTPEELLRHDAAQVIPPPRLWQRLLTSFASQGPPRKRRWWRRWIPLR